MNHAKLVRAALPAAVLLLLPACRSLIREERLGCPSQLQFQVLNPEQVPPTEEVLVHALEDASSRPLATASAPLPELADGSFRLRVPKLPQVEVYGGLGLRNGHEQGHAWVVDAGEDGAPLFRFWSRLPTLDDTALVPVEFTKEYCRITVWIVPFEEGGEDCPVRITARAHTAGIDLESGQPIAGIYRYSPEERAPGLFSFIVPRQADESLTLELTPKRPGENPLPENLGSLLLWPYLSRSDGFSWQLRNLPDADIELDIRRSEVQVSLTEWISGEEMTFDF